MAWKPLNKNTQLVSRLENIKTVMEKLREVQIEDGKKKLEGLKRVLDAKNSNTPASK